MVQPDSSSSFIWLTVLAYQFNMSYGFRTLHGYCVMLLVKKKEPLSFPPDNEVLLEIVVALYYGKDSIFSTPLDC